MSRVESIESWRGQDVLDNAGEKVGRLEEVFYDAVGDEPVLISIKHGMLGRQVKLAPLSDAAVSRDYIRLPFTGEQLGGAPDVTVGDELTAEQSAAVCALFGVPQSSGPLVGASLRARRNDEAEQARRRADELELTAAERKSEAEAASHRAGAASEAAHAAQRASEHADAAATDPGGRTRGSD